MGGNEQQGNSMNDAPQVTTESKKPLWKLVVTLLLIGGLVWGLYYVLVLSKKGQNVKEEESVSDVSVQEDWDPDADPNIDRPTVEVIITEDSFSPQTLTVEPETVIIWTNQSGETATVNSSPHPVHTDSPILNLGELADGDKFSLVLENPGTYKYHNHLNPTQFGTIEVTEEASEE